MSNDKRFVISIDLDHLEDNLNSAVGMMNNAARDSVERFSQGFQKLDESLKKLRNAANASANRTADQVTRDVNKLREALKSIDDLPGFKSQQKAAKILDEEVKQLITRMDQLKKGAKGFELGTLNARSQSLQKLNEETQEQVRVLDRLVAMEERDAHLKKVREDGEKSYHRTKRRLAEEDFKLKRKQEELIGEIENKYLKAHQAAILYNKEFDSNRARKAQLALQKQKEELQEIEKKAWEAAQATSRLYKGTAAGIKASAATNVKGMGRTEMNAYASEVRRLESNLIKLKRAGDITEDEFRDLARTLDRSKENLDKYNGGLRRSGHEIKQFNGLIDTWWKKFGKVAIGFTLAYRAMNAFEEGFRNTYELIKEAIIDTGELAGLQAELATYYTLSTGDIKNFNSAMEQSAVNVEALRVAALTSVSTLQELATGYSELAQHGVFLEPGLIDEFSAVNDAIIQIAKSTGDNAKQIRSEWQGLLDGQMKATNAFVRFLANSKLISEEQVKALKEVGNKGELVRDILLRTGDAFKVLQSQLLASKPDLAFAKWRDSLKSGIIQAVQAVSRDIGEQNIFGTIFVSHIEKLNKLFTDSANISKFKSGIELLATSLDKALTFLEGFIIGIIKFTSWIGRNAEMLKFLGSTAVIGLVVKELGILKAKFIESATAAIAAETATSKFAFAIQKLSLLLKGGSLVIGWKIGEYLNKEFLTARLAGIAFVDGTIQLFHKLQKVIKDVGAYISADWVDVVNEMKEPYINFLDDIINITRRLPFKWAKDLTVDLMHYTNELEDSINAETDLTKKLKENEAAYKKQDAIRKLTIAKMVEEALAMSNIGKAADDTKESLAGLQDVPNSSDVLLKDLEEDLKEVKSLYDRFNEAIKEGNIDRYNSLKSYAEKEIEVEIETLQEKLKKYKEYKKELSGSATAEELDGLNDTFNALDRIIVGLTDSIDESQKKLDSIDFSQAKTELNALIKDFERDKNKLKLDNLFSLDSPEYNAKLEQLKKKHLDLIKDFIAAYSEMDEETKKNLISIVENNSKNAKDIENIWENTRDVIQDTMSDFLGDALKGELDSVKDYFKAFADSMIDIWTTMLSEMVMKEFGEGGGGFQGLVDKLGGANGAPITSAGWLGMGATALSGANAFAQGNNAQGFGTMGGMAAGAALAPLTGGLSIPVAMMLGGMGGGMLGGLAGEDEPTFGEQVGDSIRDLIKALDRNTQSIMQQVEGMSDFDIAVQDMIDGIMDEGVFKDRTLAGNFAFPSASNIIGELDYAGWSDPDIKPLMSTPEESKKFLNDLFSQKTMGEFYTIMKDTVDGGTALFENMRKILGFSDIAVEDWNKIVSDMTSGSKGEQTRTTAEGIIAVMDEVFAKIRLMGKEATEDLTGWATEIERGNMTEYDRTMAEIDDRYAPLIEQSENYLEVMQYLYDTMKPAEQASESGKLLAEQIEILSNVLQYEADAIADANAKFAQSRHDTLSNMFNALAETSGDFSGMQQVFRNITFAADDYKEELIEAGMSTSFATEKAEEWSAAMKKASLETQMAETSSSLAMRKLQALGDAEGVLALQRQNELLDLQNLYGEGTPIFEKFKKNLEEIWDLEDKAAMEAEKQNAYDTIIDFYKTLKEKISNLLWDLQGGSLAPVQSQEGMMARYNELYQDALNTGDIDKFTSFVSGDFITFLKGFGNYNEVNEQIVKDLKTLQTNLIDEATLGDVADLLDDSNISLAEIVKQTTSIANIISKTNGFAAGGYHSGGLRIVGENGPEIEATGASRIFNNDDLKSAIASMGKQSNVTVIVKMGTTQFKDFTTEVIRTDPETQKQIKRIAKVA